MAESYDVSGNGKLATAPPPTSLQLTTPKADIDTGHHHEKVTGRHAPKLTTVHYQPHPTAPDRPDWQQSVQSPMPIQEMVERLHDFKAVVRFELVGGWQRKWAG